MQISFKSFKPELFNNNKPQKTQNNNLNPLKLDTVSFTSKKLLCAEDFLSQAVSIFGGNTEKEIITRTVNAAIGQSIKGVNSGTSSTFFNIPEIADYGIKINSKVQRTIEHMKNNKFYHVKDTLCEHNFGQPVLKNVEGIEILKRVGGEPSSINNWAYYAQNPQAIQYEQANEYINKLFKISKMPQEAFDGFANKIDIISKQNTLFLDTKNPNNIMVDFKNNEITPIDLRYTRGANYNNTFKDMTAPLTDASLQRELKDQMSQSELFIVNDCIARIVEKTENALGMFF